MTYTTCAHLSGIFLVAQCDNIKHCWRLFFEHRGVHARTHPQLRRRSQLVNVFFLYIHIYIYMHIYLHIYKSIYVCVFIYLYVYVCTYIYLVYIYTYTPVYIHIPFTYARACPQLHRCSQIVNEFSL